MWTNLELTYERGGKKLKYTDIRNKYQNHEYLNMVFVDMYVMLISPLFTKIFIGLEITPNYITILMIISGITGAVLFIVPSIICKIVGILFIHLWYLLDCSDGEVARITKKFSKFGKEIDYTSHIINHPLFNIAFACTLMSEHKYNYKVIILLFMIYISSDLIQRNLLAFNEIYRLKMPNYQPINNSNNIMKRIIIYVLSSMTLYPNFALIFPILYLLDLFFKSNICFIYIVIVTFLTVLVTARGCIKWIVRIKDL